MRSLHGAMNACVNPLSYSLVVDYVPPNKRSTANSILAMATYTGISLSSLSILLIKSHGWRWAYQFMGFLGILLGLCFIGIVKEPKGKMYNIEYDNNEVETPKEEKIKKNLFKEIGSGLV